MKSIGWILLTLGLSACASLKTPTNPPIQNIPFVSLQEFLTEQNERMKNLERVRGKALIRFTDSKNSLFGESRLIRFLERSLLDVKDPMGRTRLWILANEKNLTIYEEDSQTAWRGPQGSASYFRTYFGMDLPWEELQELWLGILPKSWKKKNLLTWEFKAGVYEGALKDKTSFRFWVDPESRQIKLISWIHQAREYQIAYQDWDACSALEIQKKLLAHRVVMNLPGELGKFELEWENLSTIEESPNELNFQKGLPKGTRLIPLTK